MRKVRLFSNDHRSYSLLEKRFTAGYKFMQIVHEGGELILDMGTDEKLKLLVEFLNQSNNLKELVEMMMKSDYADSLDYKAKFEEEHKLNIDL